MRIEDEDEGSQDKTKQVKDEVREGGMSGEVGGGSREWGLIEVGEREREEGVEAKNCSAGEGKHPVKGAPGNRSMGLGEGR